MSDGFFYWYRAAWDRDGANRFLRGAVAAGLHVRNPATRRLSVLTNGPESWGEQVFVEEPELLGLTAAPPDGDISFQLWLTSDTDVTSRVRCLGEEAVVLEFDLAGMTLAEQEQTLVALVRVLEADAADAVGFVIDRHGATEDLDWDNVMAGAPLPVVPLPESFGIRKEYVTLHPELEPAESVEYGGLAVFTRPV